MHWELRFRRRRRCGTEPKERAEPVNDNEEGRAPSDPRRQAHARHGPEVYGRPGACVLAGPPSASTRQAHVGTASLRSQRKSRGGRRRKERGGREGQLQSEGGGGREDRRRDL